VDQDELIGLLRGFCVGDNVMVQPGKMREYHDILWRYQRRLTSGHWVIVDCADTEPRYRIEYNDSRDWSRDWAFSDELVHYYEN